MAKYKIEWSKEAKSDLINILEFYNKRNGNSNCSRKLHQKINNNVRFIAKQSHIGIKTDYESIKTVITGDYQIIYEVFDQFILIMMIWDCRRNPEDKNITH